MRSAGGRAGVDSGQRQLGRPSGWVRVAALVYVAALVMVTLLPIHWSLGLTKWPGDYRPQLVPFDGILSRLEDSTVETLAELFSNVLLFVPFGFLLPLLVPAMRRWWRALTVGVGVSLAIEVYQLAWPGVRNASVDDVLLNALGVLLGFAALRLTGYRRRRADAIEEQSVAGTTGAVDRDRTMGGF
jgi:glycopeptide antibiotics resistance protein